MRFLLLVLLIQASTLWAQELPRLSPNAPQDKPFRLNPSDISAKDKEFEPFILLALKTYPDAKKRYLIGLPRGEHFYVVTRLSEGTGTFEQTFIAVTEIQDGFISGKIANNLVTLKNLKVGDPVKFPESKVMDWLISKPDGSEEGNFVGKFVDSQK